MQQKRALKFLIALNSVLIALLIFIQWKPAIAFAQNAPISERYLAVAGEYQNNRDAIYLLDTKHRTLHSFEYELGRRKLMYTAVRNLEADFRNN